MLLSQETISQTLSSLNAQHKSIRDERRGLKKNISAARAEIKEMQAKRADLLFKAKVACIQGRNSYSKDAIKQDFAMGIKE